MISVEVKEHESVERALKRFKKKFDRMGILREFRKRTTHVKPSVVRRDVKLRAVYRQRLADDA